MELTPLHERPRLRGHLHLWAFAGAIPAGAFLVLSAQPSFRAASALYVATLLLVFGTSALYHRVRASDGVRRWLQRLDHSMIYLLIAGTYVPLCVVALPRVWSIVMLSIVGGLAAIGVVIKLTAVRRVQWVGYALYPIMGWVAVVAGPQMARSLTFTQIALVVGGGLAYTIGIPVLASKRPNPWPKTFGYHEVWHTFTIVAAGLHFAAVTSVVS